jgi:hypothetical protein
MVNLISRYMSSPTELHIQAVKRILRYLRETINFEVFYKMRGNRDLLVYMNNDYTRDQDDKKKKSISGYVFLLSSEAISWSLKK